MEPNLIYKQLIALKENAPACDIDNRDKFLIISDLHIGDGGPLDDAARNEALMLATLQEFYLPRGFQLVLNGDVEELFKHPLKRIRQRWKNLYTVFGKFASRTALFKLVGNHDYDLLRKKNSIGDNHVMKALVLLYKGQSILIAHGHQAKYFSEKYHLLCGFLCSRFVSPLGIKNYSVSRHSKRKYNIEKRFYDFAITNRIIAIIGHTHRPLFESLSRIDSLKFKIEQLCRAYPEAEEREKENLERKIKTYKTELEYTLARDKRNGSRGSLYNTDPLVPCVFNSGCAIGKRGITAIEIKNGQIALVHWFDRKKSTKYFERNGCKAQRLSGTDFFRAVLSQESLDYLFTRINLLL